MQDGTEISAAAPIIISVSILFIDRFKALIITNMGPGGNAGTHKFLHNARAGFAAPELAVLDPEAAIPLQQLLCRPAPRNVKHDLDFPASVEDLRLAWQMAVL